jgi:hypothetical protein
MNEHDLWDLRLSPARYLLDHRTGNRADLARRLVANDLKGMRRRRVTLLRLSLIAFNILSEQLGKDALQVARWERPESVVKEWVKGCAAKAVSRLPEDELSLWLMCGKEFDMTKEEEKTAESILRTYAKRGKKYGLFGAPKVLELYPPVWTHRTAPSRYLEILGGTKIAAEKARAALKPFEDAIWQELKQVESALRKAMSTEDTSRDADDILALAVSRAYDSISRIRYDNNHSPEYPSDVASWIAHLAPLSGIR